MRKISKITIASAILITSALLPTSESIALTTTYDSKTTDFLQGYKIGAINGSKQKILDIKAPNKGDLVKASKLSVNERYNRAIKGQQNKSVNKSKRYGDNTLVPIQLNKHSENLVNGGKIFNHDKFNQEFLQLVNKDRYKKKNLKPIKYSKLIEKQNRQRTTEIAKNGGLRFKGQAHKRPNGTPYYTVFKNIDKPQYRFTEIQAMTPYYGNPYEFLSEKALAKKIFEQYKASKSHYEILMSPQAKKITGSVMILRSDKNPDFEYFYSTFNTDKK